VANHVELSRCQGSVSSGLQVLEGLESSCVLSVLACCFFGRLFLFVPAYVCFGLAGCGWVHPDPMPRTLIVGSGHSAFSLLFCFRCLLLERGILVPAFFRGVFCFLALEVCP